MRRFFKFPLGLAVAAISALGPASASDVATAKADPKVQAARKAVRAGKEKLVEDWIRITEILATSGGEQARAKWVEAELEKGGFDAIRRDAKGNLIADIRGRDRNAKRVAFLAHLDTVAKAGADTRVRRDEPGKLRAPGIKDDSSGIAAVLAAAKALRAARFVPDRTIELVFTVEEEIGLKGAARYVDENRDQLEAVVAVDGSFGEIHAGATGIYWYKFHFRAPGAHTLQSYGSASTTHAAAKAIADLYDLPLSREPEAKRLWLNVGMLGGGEVPNAQCRDCWFSVDLRANDAGLLSETDRRVLAIGKNAAELVGVEFEAESIQKSEAATLPEFDAHPLVRAAVDALRETGVESPPVSPMGSADSNEALKRGIPGITIGATRGAGAHTPAETAEIDPIVDGTEQIVLLAAALSRMP